LAEIAACQARGDLVPDQIVLDVLTPAVTETAARGGYILDGFPRTLPQATAAAELAARLGVTLHAAVCLDAPEEVLTRRLLARARQSGRADDTADVIRHRLQVFAETTRPLVAYYAERGILGTVNADQPPESVTAAIQAQLRQASAFDSDEVPGLMQPPNSPAPVSATRSSNAQMALPSCHRSAHFRPDVAAPRQARLDM
jgi:adenylate kinase